MSVDPMRGRIAGHNYSATRQFAITPSDDDELAVYPRGIKVDVAGVLNVTLLGDDEPVASYYAAGVVHPMRPKQVHATDTTATGIIGVY